MQKGKVPCSEKKIFHGNEFFTKLNSCQPILSYDDYRKDKEEMIVSNFQIEILNSGFYDEINFSFEINKYTANLSGMNTNFGLGGNPFVKKVEYLSKKGEINNSNSLKSLLAPRLATGDKITFWATTKSRVRIF